MSQLDIYILEDDDNFRFLYEEFLGHKFRLHFMKTINEFVQLISESTERKCIIADLRLPDGSFYGYYREHLQKSIHKYLIVSDCYDLDIMREMLKKSNIVDYMTKPLNGCELSAKIEVLADRSFYPYQDLLERAYNLLSNKERTILSTIIENPGRRIKKVDLIKQVWTDTSVVSKTIDVHISNIRNKLSKLSLAIVAEDQYLRIEV